MLFLLLIIGLVIYSVLGGTSPESSPITGLSVTPAPIAPEIYDKAAQGNVSPIASADSSAPEIIADSVSPAEPKIQPISYQDKLAMISKTNGLKA